MKYRNTKIMLRRNSNTKLHGQSSRSFMRSLLSGLGLSIVFLTMVSCGSKRGMMTQSLFMQFKRVNIELPDAGEYVIDSITGEATLFESLTYTHADNVSKVQIREDSIRKAESRGSINEMQYINEVKVFARAKQRFTPEVDGRVRLDFVIYVPHEMLSDDWSMYLQPNLLHNDSVVPLEQIQFSGKNFETKQRQDYENYDAYLASIVDKSDYDSAFLDRAGISKDLRKRQELYWGIYHTQWSQLDNYNRWRNMIEERYAGSNAIQKGKKDNIYHKYMRESNTESIRLMAAGKDTTGMRDSYVSRFDRATDKALYNNPRELTVKKFPKKYRGFYVNETKYEDLANHATTEKDSLEIASHRYFFDQIAENEIRDERKDAKRRELIPYAYKTNLRLDSVVTSDSDIRYHYTQEYPVGIGLNRLRVTLDGRVSAVDGSNFILPKSDTISYFITSLAQLVDTSLIVKKTTLHRNLFDKLTIYPKYEPYQWKFNVAYNDNRMCIDTILSAYNKYTVDMGLKLDSLEMTSFASLEGSFDLNSQLSYNRVGDMMDYLLVHHSNIFSADQIKINHKSEDWDKLYELVRAHDNLQNKDVILEMLTSAVDPDETKDEIERRYKNDFNIIKNEIYPKLLRIDMVFNLSRDGMSDAVEVEYETRDGYEHGLLLLKERDYWGAIEILNNYPDYNLALCLALMGYNGRSYDLLVQLTPNSYTEYLLAIVCQRMEKDEEAIEHLFKAIEFNPNSASRARIDSETSILINTYGLHERIEALANRLPSGANGDDDRGAIGAEAEAEADYDAVVSEEGENADADATEEGENESADANATE